MKVILIVLGGAMGTLARYSISSLAHQKYGSTFPIGTLTVNLIGSFFIGLIWGILENTSLNANLRMFLFVGLLGGFTTFSSFSLETIGLFRDGSYKLALVNILLNNILGIGLAVIGLIIGKKIVP